MGMKWKHFGMYNVAFWVYGIVSAISAWWLNFVSFMPQARNASVIFWNRIIKIKFVQIFLIPRIS